jgi:hypothetical protein
MACRKYTLTNNSPFTQTYTYQECNNLMWNYDFTIEAGQTRTIWLINGTYAAPLTSVLSVSDDGAFPPPNSPTPSVTSSITPTPTSSITPTPSVTPSVTPTNSVTPTQTPTNTPTNSVTPTITSSVTPTNTPTNSVTPTNTPTNSVTPTNTPTNSVTPTNTPTNSVTPTPSSTPPIQGLFFTMQEVGLNVILSGTGTANVTSLNLSGTSTTFQPFIDPSSGMFSVGVGGDYDVYSGTTFNSAPFGTGGYIIPNIAGGNEFGISVNSLVVPIGYTGGILNGYSQFDNTDLATLSATTGTYLVQWGSSGASETITLVVS